MAVYLDNVPWSGIIRIRDLMYAIADPFRLDQGDLSFDVPESVKSAMARAIAENKTHYLQTTGVPRLRELLARRDLFYRGVSEIAGDTFSGQPPPGAFYAFLRIDPTGQPPDHQPAGTGMSLSWKMAEHLMKRGRIGSVPGADFGAHGEGYLRFCFAHDRKELTGAIQSMKALFGVASPASSPLG